MFLGDVVENLIDGDTAALLLGAGGGGAIDDGLGVDLLHGFGFFVGLALAGFAFGLACGIARLIRDLEPAEESAQHQSDQYGLHAQLPFPQLL